MFKPKCFSISVLEIINFLNEVGSETYIHLYSFKKLLYAGTVKKIVFNVWWNCKTKKVWKFVRFFHLRPNQLGFSYLVYRLSWNRFVLILCNIVIVQITNVLTSVNFLVDSIQSKSSFMFQINKQKISKLKLRIMQTKHSYVPCNKQSNL